MIQLRHTVSPSRMQGAATWANRTLRRGPELNVIVAHIEWTRRTTARSEHS
jgi:hypothetical protein